MTSNVTWVEGKRGIYLGAAATLIQDDREVATSWASEHIVSNPAHKWLLGRFVEADRANNNRQLFSLEGLQMSRPTITHAPMNINHQSRRVVGAFVATDLIYPTGDDEAAEALNPYIESLGVFWRHYFPEEYALVEHAHNEGHLYYSMECIPREIQCVGDGGCEATYEYAGRTSPSYCDHLNTGGSDKFLIDPHFTAGAVLVAGTKPGWSNADIHQLVSKHAEVAERVYDGVAEEMPHLDPLLWESLMQQLLVAANA